MPDPLQALLQKDRIVDTINTLFVATDEKDRRYNALYATHPKMKERVEDCTELARELPADLLANGTHKGIDRYIKIAMPFIHEDIERQITRGRYTLAESTVRFLLENQPYDATAHAYLGEICCAPKRRPGFETGQGSLHKSHSA